MMKLNLIENEISAIIVDISFYMHTTLGPGLLESVYEKILYFEISKRGLFVERQKSIPVVWSGIKMDLGFRSDLIVENKVIIKINLLK